jgi:hypothetical protein
MFFENVVANPANNSSKVKTGFGKLLKKVLTKITFFLKSKLFKKL